MNTENICMSPLFYACLTVLKVKGKVSFENYKKIVKNGLLIQEAMHLISVFLEVTSQCGWQACSTTKGSKSLGGDQTSRGS
jgi:hypothetical protein